MAVQREPIHGTAIWIASENRQNAHWAIRIIDESTPWRYLPYCIGRRASRNTDLSARSPIEIPTSRHAHLSKYRPRL